MLGGGWFGWGVCVLGWVLWVCVCCVWFGVVWFGGLGLGCLGGLVLGCLRLVRMGMFVLCFGLYLGFYLLGGFV